MTTIIILGLYIFLLSDEDDRHLVHPVGIGDTIEFLEVRGLFQVVGDISYCG